MKRILLIGVALVGLAAAGLATADVVVTGDTNGSVTVGQSLVVSLNDSFSGPSGGLYPYAPCDQNAEAVAHGQFGIGPLGPAEGGSGWLPLSVSCSNGTWNYSGSHTGTVPADVGSGEWVSVAVQEFIPVQFSGCQPSPCVTETQYNFNQTYPVITTSTPSSTSTATVTGQTSTTATSGTTTTSTTATSGTTTTSTTLSGSTTQATVTAPPVTVTQAMTITVTTGETTTPPPVTYRINVPSTITIQQAGAVIYITITSGDQRSLQTLCWHPVSTVTQTCLASHGIWRVKLRKAPGKQMFLLKEQGKVIARKTVTIKMKH